MRALIVFCIVASAAVAGSPAHVEECLLARFQETDRPRTDYAVLLASRYRHALLDRAAGKDVSKELEEIHERCADRAPAQARPLEKVPAGEVPRLIDGADLKGLAKALSLAAENGGGGLVPFGTQKVRASDLAKGARRLLALVESGADTDALNAAVHREFDVYRSPGAFGTGEVLFTSYASPVYDGALKKGGRYRYPIYRTPASKNHTRAEIYAGALAGKGLEIAWLTDIMDEFQIQIEGSGFIKLAEGGYLHAQFAATNGHAYQSLGKAMLKDRLFLPWEIDNLAMRRYFREHPEQQRAYLEKNPSWVYFSPTRVSKVPPTPGLTAERSVAADPKVFSRGQLGFADTWAPEYTADGRLTGRHPWRRFILAQDVGGAIKTSGRIDLYQGNDQFLADTMKEPGALYLLLPKGTPLK
jgi:membrane-bound lytic murein transglycosylase A